MPKTIVKIKTWVCPACDYRQDFDPNNESLMKKHFPDVPVRFCPACFRGCNEERRESSVPMIKETREEKKMVMTVMGEDEVDDLREDTRRKDANGKPIMRELTLEEKEQKIKDIRAALALAKELEDK